MQPGDLATLLQEHGSLAPAFPGLSLAAHGGGGSSLARSGAGLAVHWDSVDFLGGAGSMKQLLKAPMTDEPVSLALHRVGDSIIVDPAPLPQAVEEKPTPAQAPFLLLSQSSLEGGPSQSPAAWEEAALPALPAPRPPPPQEPHLAEWTPLPSGRSPRPPPPLPAEQETRFVLQTGTGADIVSHVAAPAPRGRPRSSSTGDLAAPDTALTLPQQAPSSDTLGPAAPPPDTLPHLSLTEPAPPAATGAVPPSGFTRVTHLRLGGVSMVLGSDLLAFRHSSLPAPFSVAFVDESTPLEHGQVLDWYLDNLLAGLSHTAVSMQGPSGQQQFTLVDTQHIPTWAAAHGARATPAAPAFTPEAVQARAGELLDFIKATCTADGGSYWLFRGAGQAELHLMQVSSSVQRMPATHVHQHWAYMAASICLRLARQVQSASLQRVRGPQGETANAQRDEGEGAALAQVHSGVLHDKHVRLLEKALDIVSAAAVVVQGDAASTDQEDGRPAWVAAPWRRHFRAEVARALARARAWQGLFVLQTDPRGASGVSATDALNASARYCLWCLDMLRLTLRSECWAGLVEWEGASSSITPPALASLILGFPPVEEAMRRAVSLQAQLLCTAAALARALLGEGLGQSGLRVLEDAMTALRVPVLGKWLQFCGEKAANLPPARQAEVLEAARALASAFEVENSPQLLQQRTLACPVDAAWLGVASLAEEQGHGGLHTVPLADTSATSGVPSQVVLWAACGDVLTHLAGRQGEEGAAAVQWARLPTLLHTLQACAVEAEAARDEQDEALPAPGSLEAVLHALTSFSPPRVPSPPQAVVQSAVRRGSGASSGSASPTAGSPEPPLTPLQLRVMAVRAYRTAALAMGETRVQLAAGTMHVGQFLAELQTTRKLADSVNRWGRALEAGAAAWGAQGADASPPPELAPLLAAIPGDTPPSRQTCTLAAMSAFAHAAQLMARVQDNVNAALLKCNVAHMLRTAAANGLVSDTPSQSPLTAALPAGMPASLALLSAACDLALQALELVGVSEEGQEPGGGWLAHHSQVLRSAHQSLLATGAKEAQAVFLACASLVTPVAGGAQAPGEDNLASFDTGLYEATRRVGVSSAGRFTTAIALGRAMVAAATAASRTRGAGAGGGNLLSARIAVASTHLQAGMAGLATCISSTAPLFLSKPQVLLAAAPLASAGRAFRRCVEAVAAVGPAFPGQDSEPGVALSMAHLANQALSMGVVCEVLGGVPVSLQDAPGCLSFPPPLSLAGLLEALPELEWTQRLAALKAAVGATAPALTTLVRMLAPPGCDPKHVPQLAKSLRDSAGSLLPPGQGLLTLLTRPHVGAGSDAAPPSLRAAQAVVLATVQRSEARRPSPPPGPPLLQVLPIAWALLQIHEAK